MSRLTLIVCFLACLFYLSCGSDDERSLQDYDESPLQDYVRSSTRTKPLPSSLTFKTDIGVAPNLYQLLGSKERVEQYVRKLVKHAQELYFKLPSLEPKLTIQIMNIKKVKTNINWLHGVRSDGGLADFKREGNYHLGVLGLSEMNRRRGMAHTGSACIWLDKNSTWNIKNHANFLVETIADDVLEFFAEESTAKTLAHEIGHVIGMGHNDVRESGDVKGGVMNGIGYAWRPGTTYKWTKYNNDDLKRCYTRRSYLCL